MRQIKFQKMREQELDSEKTARKLAEIGDTEQAIGVLQEYLSRLPDSGLDPDKTAPAAAPSRRSSSSTRRSRPRRTSRKRRATSTRLAKYNHEQKNVAEETKQQRMKELMDKYNALYKQAKYREAQMYAMQAQELDPDNPAAGAAVQMARMQGNIARYRDIKQNSEDAWLEIRTNERKTWGRS